MNLGSDNVSGTSPEIIDAIVRANEGTAASYGGDEITARLDGAFSELFETAVRVFPLATGTAANALALAVSAPPYGAVYCHQDSHVANDECNAPEFYTGGARVVPLPGAGGQIEPDVLTRTIDTATPHGEHNAQPAVVSLAQATELGTSYTPEQVAALCGIAHERGLVTHMDGARIANSVVHLGCAFADITWRVGIDLLSFGATKNGAMGAEALVFFKVEKSERIPFLRKRAGHLLSKMRYVSAQLEAYLANDLWRRNAEHANAMAQRLAEGLTAIPGARLNHPVEANEIFIHLPPPVVRALQSEGHAVGLWGDPEDSVVRFVTAFNTDAGELDAFIASAQTTAKAEVG